MKMDLRYQGTSGIQSLVSGTGLVFAPNLARPKVFFDAELKNAVRFREAVSALHDVVVGDLKRKPKDRQAYTAFQAQQSAEQQLLRRSIEERVKQEELLRINRDPTAPNLEKEFRNLHGVYWKARRKWASELMANDPEMFRSLVPCDPVVTVAPDVVFFECFSKDESAYGCLSVDRDAFSSAGEAGLGTTNVDYSLGLYDHFQTLRSYRPTRLLVDPTGFEVKSTASFREEKIDLPNSWLRGFGQVQAALCLPSERVQISVEALYSVLSVLRRTREKSGPRSLRFVLTPDKPTKIILEPWGIEVSSFGGNYHGPVATEIKVWGRRRLLALSRLLPLTTSIEVRLLGSGLPSIWVLRMGEMNFTLALSGWTANDLTGGTGLDSAYVSNTVNSHLVDSVRAHLERERRSTERELTLKFPTNSDLSTAIHVLAKRGQVIFDYASNCYRYRQIMPFELSEQVLGPEPQEQQEGLRLADSVTIERLETFEQGKRLFVAKVQGTHCEALYDLDGQMSRARCSCSYFYRFKLRAGPCRHLLALRIFTQKSVPIRK
jgi:SWIM zinc finger